MSLIDDALRRAQAAQTPGPAGTAGFRAPMPLPDPWRSRRRRFRRLAGASLATLVLVAAGVFFFLRRPWEPREAVVPPSAPPSLAGNAAPEPTASATPSPAPTRSRREPPPAAAARGASPTAIPREEQRPSPSPPAVTAATAATVAANRATPARPTASRTPSLAARATVAPTVVPRREPPPAPPPVPPPAEISGASGSPRIERPPEPEPTRAPTREPARAPAPPTRAPVPTREPRVYVGTANTPSGKLELEGIVFSETNPTALINGRVVGPGGYVEGFTVVSIAADRVELESESGRIVLTLH